MECISPVSAYLILALSHRKAAYRYISAYLYSQASSRIRYFWFLKTPLQAWRVFRLCVYGLIQLGNLLSESLEALVSCIFSLDPILLLIFWGERFFLASANIIVAIIRLIFNAHKYIIDWVLTGLSIFVFEIFLHLHSFQSLASEGRLHCYLDLRAMLLYIVWLWLN